MQQTVRAEVGRARVPCALSWLIFFFQFFVDILNWKITVFAGFYENSGRALGTEVVGGGVKGAFAPSNN